MRALRRFGVGRGAAALTACAALACASCQLLFGLDDLTGGTCDAHCGAEVAAWDAAWPSSQDATLTNSDGDDESLGTTLPDASDEVPPGAGPPEAGLPEAGQAEADPPEAGLPEAGPPEASPPEAGQPEAGADAGSPCTCVPPPPIGWTGPIAVWEGSGPAPGCSGDYPAQVLDALAALDAGAPQCACGCGPLTGASCPSSFTATIFSDPGCTTACDSVTVSAGACVNVHGQCANVHGIGASPQAQGGSCAPQASAFVPTAGWGRTARACESAVPPVQSGCASGQICAPAPAAPMEPRLCVFMAGVVPCPAGGYSVQRTVYAGVADTRGCTPCSCGAPSDASCTGTLQEGCGQTGPVNQLPTACGGLSDPGSVLLVAAPVLSGGSCRSDGGVPAGSAVPSSPTTVCCMP